jgi:hypothetical protein
VSAFVRASLTAAATRSSTIVFSGGLEEAFVNVDAEDPALGSRANLHHSAAGDALHLDLVEIVLGLLQLGLRILRHLHD